MSKPLAIAGTKQAAVMAFAQVFVAAGRTGFVEKNIISGSILWV